MTISYELAPNPKWYFADLTGKPLSGGSLNSYLSLDKTQFKLIYQDAAGNFPWPDPILLDANGTQGPFYFSVDTNNPDETYYLEVYDSNGVLQWTIDNFSPSGGGGGSVITTALDLENLIVNEVMWRNIGTSVSPLPVLLKLAPGAHAGFAANAEADIIFKKNNTNATDQITFTPFTLGSTPLTGDITPYDYLKYVCTNTPAGETSKFVQFPITTKVQNLSNQNITTTIWARSNSGTPNLTLYFRQFFGDGVGASADVRHTIQTILLTSSWQKFSIQDTIPNVSGKVLGGCGNDALFLQVEFPLGAACNIDFTKPSLYLGNITPTEDYRTYDMIDAVINAQRTGYIMSGFDTSAPPGYVIMNDGSIGSASSAATTRASIDTFPLFNLLWNNVSDTYAPVSGGRGLTAIADFTANKRLTLTLQLGRALAAAGFGAGLTPRVLGEALGSENTTLIADNLPSHTHIGAGSLNFVMQGVNAGVYAPGGQGSIQASTGVNAPSGVAFNNMQPTSFMNFFIKL